jgi:hypothetical protein
MTQDEIIEMTRQAGLHVATDVNWMPIIGLEYAEKLIALARADEREACAEVCKKHADVYALLEQNPHAFGTAKPAWAACIDNRDAIRARGQA